MKSPSGYTRMVNATPFNIVRTCSNVELTGFVFLLHYIFRRRQLHQCQRLAYARHDMAYPTLPKRAVKCHPPTNPPCIFIPTEGRIADAAVCLMFADCDPHVPGIFHSCFSRLRWVTEPIIIIIPPATYFDVSAVLEIRVNEIFVHNDLFPPLFVLCLNYSLHDPSRFL